jgi:dephospho-CoA kinase
MAYDAGFFMDDDPKILLKRFGSYVSPYPAKKLSRWIGCTEKTADAFRRGESWPNARHWQLIVRHFGRDILAAVFEPEIDETLARLRREERELREKLHEIEARRIKASGGLAELQERRHEDLDRSSVAADLFEERV